MNEPSLTALSKIASWGEQRPSLWNTFLLVGYNPFVLLLSVNLLSASCTIDACHGPTPSRKRKERAIYRTFVHFLMAALKNQPLELPRIICENGRGMGRERRQRPCAALSASIEFAIPASFFV